MDWIFETSFENQRLDQWHVVLVSDTYRIIASPPSFRKLGSLIRHCRYSVAISKSVPLMLTLVIMIIMINNDNNNINNNDDDKIIMITATTTIIIIAFKGANRGFL